MKRYIIALVFGVISFAAFAQQEQFVSLEIDRIFVKNGDRFSYSLEWDEYEAKKMGLIQRHKQYPYEVGSGNIRYFDHSWWSWEDEYITKTTLTDGSIKSSYQSSYISVSVNLHPQWLILSIKNLTSNYLVLDLNLGLVSVSPPEPNLKNRKYDVETSMVTLENYYGSKYHTAILPPNAEIDVPYYNKLWKYKRSSGDDKNIIYKDVENGARVDLNLSIGIFRTDPISQYKALMQNAYEEEYYFGYDTPSQYFHKYQGGFFKYGSAYYIAEDYAQLFNSPDMLITEQIICKYARTSRLLPTKQNELGFMQFGQPSSDNSNSQNINSLIQKETSKPKTTPAPKVYQKIDL